MNKKFEIEEIDFKDKESVEAWYEEMNRQFEEDSKTHDFSLSEEWDADFRRAMFGTKYVNKRKSRKMAYIAAGIAATVLVGLGVTQKEVIGENLEKIFNSKSNVGDSELEHFGTKEEMSAGENGYDRVFVYKDKTLTEVYAQIKEALKRPFFQIQDDIGEYEIEDAVYDAEYNMIMIELITEEGRIFLSQREMLENAMVSNKNDDSSIVVWNETLDTNIVIDKSIQDDSYTFSVKQEYIVFSFYGSVSQEICCEIARNLLFK